MKANLKIKTLIVIIFMLLLVSHTNLSAQELDGFDDGGETTPSIA